MNITRTDKATGASTTLTLNEAVDQFILDNLAYAEIEDPEDYVDDMDTVFETQSMFEDMGDDGIDAGAYLYTIN
jgi:hypothetical protein